MTHILVCTFCPQLKSHKQVKRGAILGTMNKANENIFNCPVATKQLLFRCYSFNIQVIYPKAFSFPIGHPNAFPLLIGPHYCRLLDLLSAEPRWGEGDVCEECQVLLWYILNFSSVSFNLWKHGKYSSYTQHRQSLD